MLKELQLDANEYLPLREVVYTTIRKAILKETLKPGERLMENTVAEKLGVSRTPVREALRMLSDEGLVVLIPRRGAQVAQISAKELNDVLEVRVVLEELATIKACEHMTDEDLAAFEEALEDFRQSTIGGDITEIAEADIRFHDVLYRLADNRRLQNILSNLREQMYRYRLEYLKKEGVYETLIREHEEILEAVRRGDAAGAKELMRMHVENQRSFINETLLRSAH